MTDTERLDWLQKNGMGLAIIEDDNGHWACAGDGMQEVPLTAAAQDLYTSFFIKKKFWRKTLRGAIDAYIKDFEKNG